jgi:hypothetical protein
MEVTDLPALKMYFFLQRRKTVWALSRAGP